MGKHSTRKGSLAAKQETIFRREVRHAKYGVTR